MHKDIGIKYTQFYNTCENKFISGACLTQDHELLICENHRIIKKLSFVSYSNSYNTEVLDYIKEDDIKAIAEYQGKVYLLDNKEKKVIAYDDNKKKYEILSLSKEEEPLSISVSEYGIAITCLPSCIYHYDKRNITKIDINFVSEPIYIEQKNENVFLVTDSLSHIIYEIDKRGKILWSFGMKDEPGWDNKSISMPMCSIYGYNKSIFIAEQRNHRILHISYDKKVIKEYGKCLYVGLKNGRLWAPNFVLYDKENNYIFAVLSKSGTIMKIHNDVYSTIYGWDLIEYSEFNFQRSCEWNSHLQRILVADTGHNRVLIMDKNGTIIKQISTIDGTKLECPRCAVWLNDDIIITDSRNKRVFLLKSDYSLTKQYCFANYDFCHGNNWLQVALINKMYTRLLVATSQDVRVFDLNNFSLVWSSDEYAIKLKDIHHVQFSENEIIISDTGNNRIVFVNQRNKIHTLEYVNVCGQQKKLKSPRMAKRIAIGLLIVDSGNSKVYILDDEFNANVIFCHGDGRGLKDTFLSAPRWASFYNDMLFISDTDNHRIVIREVASNADK